MSPTPFTDAAAAIDEAVFLAAQHGRPYALIDMDGDKIIVMPLYGAHALDILEIVHP